MSKRDIPKRKRIDITLPPELVKWIDETVKKDYTFRNRSHFIEVLTQRYRKERQDDEG